MSLLTIWNTIRSSSKGPNNIVSMKSEQWEPRWYMRVDGHEESNMCFSLPTMRTRQTTVSVASSTSLTSWTGCYFDSRSGYECMHRVLQRCLVLRRQRPCDWLNLRPNGTSKRPNRRKRGLRMGRSRQYGIMWFELKTKDNNRAILSQEHAYTSVTLLSLYHTGRARAVRKLH